jgi:SDR family mycofactocin-dependent oxidoreductase
MARVAGKVALITGAARGQGRSHAVRLAEEGADVIALDICADIDIVKAPLGTAQELADTAQMVADLGRRVATFEVDVRDLAGLKAAIDDGVAQLGRLDIAVANAGICTAQRWHEVTPEIWKDTIDVNLTGIWNTCFASAQHLIDAGGGSMILISSTAGIQGYPFLNPYAASKHGVVGIMHTLANELAEHAVRVNTVHPTGVDTPMGESMGRIPELLAESPHLGGIFQNALDVQSVESIDISNAVLYLASDEARYVTGLQMTVDAGVTGR